MKNKLFIAVILLATTCLTFCVDKRKIDRKNNTINVNIKDSFLITTNSVGKIKLGVDINEHSLQKLLQEDYKVSQKNNKETYIQSDGPQCNHFFAYYKNKLELVLVGSCLSENDDKIRGIKILSPKYKTEKGLKVGMHINEILALYPDMRIMPSFMGDNTETLYLKNDDTENITIFLQANDGKPLVNNTDSILNNNVLDGSDNFRKNGTICQINIKQK